jgi:GDPmannose 4,6-dehydratase
MTKRALITGITGQDGSHLAEHLLGLGYEIHGTVRPVAAESAAATGRIAHLINDISLHSASIESYPSIYRLIGQYQFDECYHLAARSFVAESFLDGFSTMSVNINGTHYILAALCELQPHCRFYFAGSSEMFGNALESPQNENTPFRPRSPYGISKVAGFHLTRNFRETHGMFCSSGILFNHEGPRRGREFVTRKISIAVARIKLGLATELRLGNVESRRDWGHAADYVEGMYAMLQQPEPDDYVIATGETHSVKEFCEMAFACVGLDYRDYLVIDEKLYRPSESYVLTGDSSKARSVLNWRPKHTFQALVSEMVESDLEIIGRTLK